MPQDPHETLQKLIEAEAITVEESYKLYQLLEEMTQITDNFIVWIIEYCQKHKIPILNEEQLRGYIKMSRILLRETGEKISNLIESRKLPLKKFDRRSPEDLPDPVNSKLINSESNILQKQRTNSTCQENSITVASA